MAIHRRLERARIRRMYSVDVSSEHAMRRRTKGQHFLLSAAARTLSLAAVLRMSDREAISTSAISRDVIGRTAVRRMP